LGEPKNALEDAELRRSIRSWIRNNIHSRPYDVHDHLVPRHERARGEDNRRARVRRWQLFRATSVRCDQFEGEHVFEVAFSIDWFLKIIGSSQVLSGSEVAHL
jgi:hypothetical protein